MKQLNVKKLVFLNLPYFLLGLFATMTFRYCSNSAVFL